MVRVTYESRSVHFPSGDEISVGEFINFFGVERGGMHLKARRGNAFQNIWPDQNGMFRVPQDLDTAILIALKKEGVEEHDLDVVRRTPAFLVNSINANRCTRAENDVTNSGDQQMGSSYNRTAARRGNATVSRFFQTSSGITPTGTSRTFSNISRSFGTRPAPSVWNAKGMTAGARNKRRKTMETKSFRLTFFDIEANLMQDMWDIPIDLTRLAELYGMFSVFDITRELENQLGEGDPDAKVVVTDMKGNPVKDMVTTRG